MHVFPGHERETDINQLCIVRSWVRDRVVVQATELLRGVNEHEFIILNVIEIYCSDLQYYQFFTI